jgi:terminase small subunit-like protein
MPALKNQRHEKFVLALFEGKSATEAYTAAGYKPCRKNAARLTTFDDIKARLAELQNAVAEKSEVTVESLLDELEHARQRADGLDQLSAAVKAISEKAKISGLLTQRIEIGGPGSFDDCESTADMADAMLNAPGGPVEGFRPVDERDRQGLIDLLERYEAEFSEFMSGIKARPITAVRCDLANLRPDWRQLELHPSAYVDNPAQRRWDEVKRQRELKRRRIGNGRQR